MKLADKRVKEQLTKAAKITSDYYPETMYKMFIINAPSFFTFLWGFCKGLVNEKTREKIHIYSKPSQWMPALQEHIDEDKLPELFGGTCKCKFGCMFNDPGPWNPDNLLYDKYTKLPEKKLKEVPPLPQPNMILSLDSDIDDENSVGFCDIKRSDLVTVNEIYQIKFDKYKFPVKQIPPELSTIRDEVTEAD